MSLLLGCIADDFTGATDLADALVNQGMRTVQWGGVPDSSVGDLDAEAVIIALKTRTSDPQYAVRRSLEALAWLRDAGARQFYFKYCSTFDSSKSGNIGPVMDALLDGLGEGFTIACPAFPENRRTVYMGHLFVGGVLLSESGMRNHPLTPMTDANLVRVLGGQVKGEVGLVPFGVVENGPEAILNAYSRLQGEGKRYAVVDALNERHLFDIGEACAGLGLVTGGSGAAIGLPANFRRRALLGEAVAAAALPSAGGHAAVLSGSCSPATLAQIGEMEKSRPSLYVDALAMAKGKDVAAEALEWALPRLDAGPVLIYASARPEVVSKIQRELGRERAGELVEQALAEIADGLVNAGVRRLVVAGGETGGAVVKRLGAKGLRIGPRIDPGVPWTMSLDEPNTFLALKSGNFGAPDFFLKAFEVLG